MYVQNQQKEVKVVTFSNQHIPKTGKPHSQFHSTQVPSKAIQGATTSGMSFRPSNQSGINGTSTVKFYDSRKPKGLYSKSTYTSPYSNKPNMVQQKLARANNFTLRQGYNFDKKGGASQFKVQNSSDLKNSSQMGLRTRVEGQNNVNFANGHLQGKKLSFRGNLNDQQLLSKTMESADLNSFVMRPPPKEETKATLTREKNIYVQGKTFATQSNVYQKYPSKNVFKTIYGQKNPPTSHYKSNEKTYEILSSNSFPKKYSNFEGHPNKNYQIQEIDPFKDSKVPPRRRIESLNSPKYMTPQVNQKSIRSTTDKQEANGSNIYTREFQLGRNPYKNIYQDKG